MTSPRANHTDLFHVLLASHYDELVKASDMESVANYIQHALAFLTFILSFDIVFNER